MGFGLRALRRLTTRGDLAEEAQGIGLVAAFLVLAGKRQRTLSKGLRLLQAARQQMRLSKGEKTERLAVYSFRHSALLHRPREQRHGIGDAPAQGIRRTQGRSHPGEIDREFRVLTDGHSPFEQGECPAQIALAEGQQTDPPRGIHEARRVSHRLGDPEPFFPEGPALGEGAQLSMARRRGGHGRARRAGRPGRSARSAAPRRGPPQSA